MKRLLKDVRVIDFSWIGAGSYTTKILADLGADVIKIETAGRLDTLRLTKPFKDGIAGVNRSGYFADRNSSKRSITLNAKHPDGLALAKRLAADADLVANNFTPGVMDKLGLGYKALRSVNPRLIYASMSVQGAEGPDKNALGYGLTIAAVTGLLHMTGLPDREPAGTGTNYPDHIPNPGHTAFAILAALRHQRRTGQGQFIDLAQVESTQSMMGPDLMNYFVNGVVDTRRGNRHPERAPQGVYPCAGVDRWIALSICSDDQWRALADLLRLNARPQWSNLAGRLAEHDAIDAVIQAASRNLDARTLADAMQARGIAAGMVLDARDVLETDPQLAARGHWVTLDHPEVGPSTYNSAPYRYSDAKASPTSPAPLLGQHTREVCRELLGLDDPTIDQLTRDGVLA
jgi:crotonobetainyl-CoA:carnitine CoA-transferase CaiB-like acyl-CoA transferase